MTDVHSSTGADARPQSTQIGRRSFLAGITPMMLAATSVPASVSSRELHELIDAHRAAWEALRLAGQASDDAEDAEYEGVRPVELIGNCDADVFTREEVIARTQAARQRVIDEMRHSYLGHLIAPEDLERAIAVVIEERDRTIAEINRKFDERDARRAASPAGLAEAAYRSAAKAEDEAIMALLSFRPTGLAEAAERAAYVLASEHFETLCSRETQRYLQPLLASFQVQA